MNIFEAKRYLRSKGYRIIGETGSGRYGNTDIWIVSAEQYSDSGYDRDGCSTIAFVDIDPESGIGGAEKAGLLRRLRGICVARGLDCEMDGDGLYINLGGMYYMDQAEDMVRDCIAEIGSDRG